MERLKAFSLMRSGAYILFFIFSSSSSTSSSPHPWISSSITALETSWSSSMEHQFLTADKIRSLPILIPITLLSNVLELFSIEQLSNFLPDAPGHLNWYPIHPGNLNRTPIRCTQRCRKHLFDNNSSHFRNSRCHNWMKLQINHGPLPQTFLKLKQQYK